MIYFFFIRVRLIVGFTDTLCDNFLIALAMASVLAIFTLHTSSILEKISAERTAHNIVELLSNEFVSLFLVNFFFSLANSTLTVQTNIKWSAILQLFC